MLLTELRVQNFRNLASVRLEADPHFNVVTGANGQGKTNLIEAIHLLSTLRSFRSFRNRDLLRDDATEAVLEAETLRHQIDRHLRVRIRPHGKRVEVNDAVQRDLQRYYGSLNTVVFTPEDTGVLRASPSDRRLFLDRMIFNARPTYALEFGDYETVVKNRNAILKEDRPDLRLLDVYDQQLASLGARITRQRVEWLRQIEPGFQGNFQAIFGDLPAVGLVYHCAWDEALDPHAPVEKIEAQLLLHLNDTRARDIQRGFSQSGPHRDDWSGTLDGAPIRIRGSQGQHRAFVLALKITEIQTLFDLFGDHPILLLDDVSSELDPERNARLFEFLQTFPGQVFLTTTDLQYVPLRSGFRQWHVHHGEVHAG